MKPSSEERERERNREREITERKKGKRQLEGRGKRGKMKEVWGGGGGGWEGEGVGGAYHPMKMCLKDTVTLCLKVAVMCLTFRSVTRFNNTPSPDSTIQHHDIQQYTVTLSSTVQRHTRFNNTASSG